MKKPKSMCGAAYVAVAVLLAAACLLKAQSQTEKAPPRASVSEPRSLERRQDRPAPGFRGGAGFERLFGILTEEQRAALRQEMEKERATMRELEQKAQAARRALFETSLTERFEENAVRQKAMEMAKIDAELAVLRMKAFSKMKPALSPEQIQELANAGPGVNPESRNERKGRRPEVPHDENGLPLKPPGSSGETNSSAKP